MFLNDVFKGDIVTVIERVFVDWQGGKWQDHFFEKKVHYVVIDEMSSNNGNFRGKRQDGRWTWLNMKNVIEIKRGKIGLEEVNKYGICYK